MSKRKHGNYHVLHGAFDGWQVAQCCKDGWLVTGIQQPMLEGDFEEIGPRIPAPDEDWQTVPTSPSREMLGALYGDKFVGTEAADEEGYWAGMLSVAPKP